MQIAQGMEGVETNKVSENELWVGSCKMQERAGKEEKGEGQEQKQGFPMVTDRKSVV